MKTMPLHSRIPVFVIIILLFISYSGSCRSQAIRFGKNKVQYKDFKWKILNTPHFDIHFDEGDRDLAARTAVYLEYGYQKHSRSFGHNISWRIPVILYDSHSDFQQTNTTWGLIPEGAMAFAEPNRKRIVLHFSGSNEDFSQTCMHELVHIFQFDMVYGNLLRSVFSRNFLFQVPLWLMEGMAEYYSAGGVDTGCEMYIRDAAVFDYLPYNLEYTGGYFVYKTGQSAINYINETYGDGKIIEILDQLKFQRSADLALKSTIGINTEELTRDWKKSLRKKYWPVYANKNEPESHGRRLTDHMKNHNFNNSKPEFSSDGESIVYYSDRDGLDGIYLLNALTGEVEKKLLIGTMSDRFESIRTMRSSLTWDPVEERIAFVAKSSGRDKLFVMKVPEGKIENEIELPLDFFFDPSWSPDGARIALVGTVRGQTDIYIYELAANRLMQVTDDLEDEKEPVWFQDGGRIAYVRYPENAVEPLFVEDSTGTDRLSGIDFSSLGNVVQVTSDIWSIDLDSGEKKVLISTAGNDESPVIMPGGDEIVFVSDETGISNLYRGSLDVGSYYRFTDVLGGIFTPAYSASKDRLVFSAFNSAGYDIFIMDEFSEKSKEAYSTGSPMMAMSEESGDSTFDGEPEGGGISTADAIYSSRTERDVGYLTTGPDTTVVAVPERTPKAVPDIVIKEDSKEGIDPDTLTVLRDKFRKKIGTIEPYNLSFSADYVGNGMGLFFSTGFGFGLMNSIAFSDLMGDHHLFFAFNIYRSIEDSDLMLSYYYLKKRIDYGVGIFQYKNYLYSRLSSVGEAFLDYRYFTERNYGVFGLASYPFSMFTRTELELQAFVSERSFLSFETYDDYYNAYYLEPGETSKKRLIQPTLSLIHDTAYYGSFGPVIGSKFMISYSRALSFSGDDVSRTGLYFDYRKYQPVFYRNSLAFRSIVSFSEGNDLRYFFLGGPTTMRGYDYLQFQGSKIMLFNLEYRYPLVDAIVFGWPGRWAITNIGGTLFFDTGSVWGPGRYVEPLPLNLVAREINGLKFYSDFGIGFFMRMGFMVLNFQLGWPTDFNRTSDAQFHFYIGPQF